MTELDTEEPSKGDKGGRGMPEACVSHSREGEGFVSGGEKHPYRSATHPVLPASPGPGNDPSY
ncbi:hypothetical protein GCM10010394_15280 [Streptomyces crystallinus]|uniref:Uncharacterized protein n=1 Tax=Streptomyces crystallinus TaxID=68191 RepID=A0ABN1FBT9_9ACTN